MKIGDLIRKTVPTEPAHVGLIVGQPDLNVGVVWVRWHHNDKQELWKLSEAEMVRESR